MRSSPLARSSVLVGWSPGSPATTMRGRSTDWRDDMARALTILLLTLMVAACGGGPSAGQTGSPRPVGTPGTTVAGGGEASPASGQATADELCALLTADDWGEFNYVTA